MVCKELDELCAKFGSLSPHLRIDYIYGMLRMCLPPELRFIGSVVEDLAKKDFNHLREHENKANNQTELKKYRNVDEKTLIEGMAFNLSLLHSVNTPCANIIFSLLEENSKSAFHISNSTDKKTIDIILLVLTMAKYHPAFTFHQRTVFTEYYKKVEQQLHNIYAKTNDNDRHSPNPTATQCYTCSVASKVHSPPNHHKAYITCIDMIDVLKQEKIHRRHDRKHEYRIQVSWSNNEKTEVTKTYQELREFHQKVHQQFPDEENIKHDGVSFYLGSPQKDDGHDKGHQQVTSFVSYLSNLPKYVRESDHFIQFFKGDNFQNNPPLPEQSALPDIPPASDGNTEDVESMFTTPYTPMQSFTVYNSNFPQGESVGCIPSAMTVQHVPFYGPIFRPPYQSPASSGHASPNNSRSASPGDTGIDQITALVNKLQLQRYRSGLDKFTIEQLTALPIDMMVKECGMSMEDATRISAELEERSREKPPTRLPNGIIEPCIPGPMSHYQALYMPPPQPMYPMMPYQIPSNVIAARDTSSSENSSPSRSPVPQKKPPQKGADSSSDDSEKGNRVDSPFLDAKKEVHYPSQNTEEVNSETPLQAVHHAFENVHGHSSSGSGYQSDPTPTQGPFMRVIFPNNSYKAQPTHNNLNFQNKTFISMPDTVGGRRVGYAYPYQRCDNQTLTTTVASNSNSNGPELTRRPVIPGQIPIIRSPTVSGNGRNFMCSVTASATPVMAANLQNSLNGNIRHSGLAPSVSDPGLSPNQDSQNGSGNQSPLPNGNPVTCSGPNGHISHAHCTSCGCTGSHQVPSYQVHLPNHHYLQNQMMFPPFMNANPNGIVHHPYYHHPHFQYPISNGIPPSYLQAINPHPYPNVAGAQYSCFPPVVLQRRNSAGYNAGKPQRTTSATCSNCGSTDHISSECKESSMESMSASFHLKYDPKSNSD
ncbi:unnamed protein product [Mytilus coruscus]|uniref:CCHC-type domain-containing protein n=1 Tax=Mytilus coruscus TaxID=42192 RepID=A0A6J8C3M4_MYTCO|nr:unnamed protein product [Mytilus coruscus]